MRGPVKRGSTAALIPRISSSLSNESLYGVWTTHGIVHNFEMGKNSPLNPSLMMRPIFGRLTDPKSQLEVIAKALGMSPAQVKKLRGFDITGDCPDTRVFHQGLRFCQMCLDLGYHSILYQHVGMALCPLHTTPFHDVCPTCKNVIVPTFATALVHPFECPHCLVSLASTIYRPQDLQVAMLADQMAEGRRAILASSGAAGRHRLYFDDRPCTMQTPSTPAVSRHYQRATVWAEPGDSQWTKFPEERMSIIHSRMGTEENSADSLDLGLAAERVIIWLLHYCHAHEKSAQRLAQRLGRYPRGLRLNAHASVIGTALYKLFSAYDLVQEAQIISDIWVRSMNSKAIACYGKIMPRYGPDEPDFPKLNFRLLQLEMYGMFAKLLAGLKSNSPLSEVSWLDIPHALEFAPTWLLTKTADDVSVRIRARVNEKTLERLIKRRWSDQLVYESKDDISYSDFWRDNQLDTVWHEKRELDMKFSLFGERFEIREPSQRRVELVTRRSLG